MKKALSTELEQIFLEIKNKYNARSLMISFDGVLWKVAVKTGQIHAPDEYMVFGKDPQEAMLKMSHLLAGTKMPPF